MVNYTSLLNNPNINRRRRHHLSQRASTGRLGARDPRYFRYLRRRQAAPDIQETVIIHSDSEEEESRINEQISRIRRRMDELDDEKANLKVDMAKLYQERENVRRARDIRINNLRLRREFEDRLLPAIESVAERRQEIIRGATALFEGIDDHPTELPPAYEDLFPERVATTSTEPGTTTATANGNDSDTSTSSTISLPPASELIDRIIRNGH